MDPLHFLLTNKKRGWSGESAMVAQIARGLVKRGYRVSLATNPKAVVIERLKGSGVEILEVTFLKNKPQIFWTLPQDMGRLARYIRSEKVALVHSHASFDTWTTALVIRSQRLGIPLVRTKHNVKTIHNTWANHWYYGRAIDCLIAPSRAVEQDLLNLDYVDRDKIHYIPNGIAIDEDKLYQKGKAEARKSLSIPADAKVVAYISRLTRQKDPGILIPAIFRLLSSYPKLLLLFIGADNNLQAELERLAGGHSAIEFWGHREDVSRILSAIDVFVLPSLAEAFGLAPLEAMLQGVPTIVSDAMGFRDFVEDGKNGLVFPKGNLDALVTALERLLSDNELRTRLSIEGARTVREYFHVDRMVDEVEKLYLQILKNKF